jgi:deazaflavin-dependent oxidoreductase (nitroreductase family)
MELDQQKIDKYLPAIFKRFNRLMVLMWKLGMGKLINCYPPFFGRIMVISHQGRGTGSPYQTPVNYFPQGEYIYCTSAFGGQSDWYLNVIANPQVEIWLPDGWFTGKAELVENSEERSQMLRKVLIASGFAAPLFAGVDPKEIDEETFVEMTADYRLLRIQRQSPRTGDNGPGSLAWLWPILTFLLLCRRRRKRK